MGLIIGKIPLLSWSVGNVDIIFPSSWLQIIGMFFFSVLSAIGCAHIVDRQVDKPIRWKRPGFAVHPVAIEQAPLQPAYIGGVAISLSGLVALLLAVIEPPSSYLLVGLLVAIGSGLLAGSRLAMRFYARRFE